MLSVGNMGDWVVSHRVILIIIVSLMFLPELQSYYTQDKKGQWFGYIFLIFPPIITTREGWKTLE
jgi:hypothetical protein